VTIENYYQQSKYPEGARFIAANEEMKIDEPGIDHFSIVSHWRVKHAAATAARLLREL